MAEYTSDSDDAASLNGDAPGSTHWEYTSSGAEAARPMDAPAPRFRAIPSFSSFTRLSPGPPDFGDSSTVPTGTTTGMTSVSSSARASSSRVDQLPNATAQVGGEGAGSESPLTRLLSSAARQVRGRDITVHALTVQESTLGIVFSSELQSASQSESQSASQSESQPAPADAPGQLILLSKLIVSTGSSNLPEAPESWLGRYSSALTQPSLRGALTEVIRASIGIPALPADEAGGKGCFHKEASREPELLNRQGGKSTVRVSALRNNEQGERVRILVDFDPNGKDIRRTSTLW